MEIYQSEQEYLADLEKRASLPEGFRVSHTTLTFTPQEKAMQARMNLSLILADRKTEAFGAVFTKNSFPGFPVIIGRERMKQPCIQGMLINNKVSNVCTPGGYETACTLLQRLGSELQMDAELLLPFSTGIIGWQLPLEAMSAALPELSANLNRDSLLPIARAIMTTDAFPKVRCAEVGSGRVVGIAKGAGMIEPNLATMLVFLLTDVGISRIELDSALTECAATTFNRISIDSDQSTSDSAVLISSCLKHSPGYAAFKDALYSVCSQLAGDIVRNGEGTGHVIRVSVMGDLPEETALGLGKAVVNSPLCKTAIFGNDPNVGRIIGAIGDYLGSRGIPLDKDKLVISLGGMEIFKNNRFYLDGEKEKELSCYLEDCKLVTSKMGYPQHDRIVEIEIRTGGSSISRSVLGSDLSYDYVRENADYRT